jgi:glycosyltransferase involved in cell wall biosynthesis
MVDSPILAERLRIVHMDTSDRRGVANIGRFDWWNAWLGFKHAGQFARLLVRERPDITMLTASQGTLGLVRDSLLASMGRWFRSKSVIYLRGSGYAELRQTQGWLAKRLLYELLKHSSAVLVLSQSLVNMAHSVYPRARVAVVPNGCRPAATAGREGTRDESHPIVAYIGRLGREKGIDEAIEAVRAIAPSLPALEVVLGGGWDHPEYESHVRGLLSRYGLTTTVKLPGPVSGEPKAELLARAWLLIVPSHSEGQPWVILEAMSAGVPVVATDTGAIAETVEDGVAGFVVPVGDGAALASRMLTLLQDDDLWRRMSVGALRRYQERFTMERSHSLLADELCRVARED